MALYTATTLVDESDPSPGGAQLSLREALALANATVDADDIVFGSTLSGTISLNFGQLTISNSVTINGDADGNGTTDITIDAHDASRIFQVTAGTSTLDHLVMTRGQQAGEGGGIRIYSGAALTLANSTVSDSDAVGLVSPPGRGGGIWSAGALQLIDSTVSGNTSDLEGGGIYLGGGGSLVARNATISNNYADGSGGGLAVTGSSSATVIDTTVSGNGSGFGGGGIGQFGAGVLTLTNSTLSDNFAGFSGGGLLSENAVLTNVTVWGNEALTGGGIGNRGALVLTSSTVTGNYATSLGGGLYNYAPATLTNSIVAGNDAVLAEDDFHDAGTSTQTNTLVGGTLANVFAALTTIDPGVVGGPTFQAGALADNAGPVQTVAILLGGDADGTGSNAALPQDPHDLDGDGITDEALPVDARGGQRVVGANVDVGAFEAGQLIVTTSDDETAATTDFALELADGDGLSLREALAIANAVAGPETITFNLAPADRTLFLTTGQQLEITTDGITINGDLDGDGTADITIDADSGALANDAASRVFRIDNGAASTISAALNGLVIQDGVAAFNNGAGIFVGQGDALNLSNATVSDNSAGFHGGGIYAIGGAITLTNVTVSGNTAPVEGGGIFSVNAALSLTNVTVSGNDAHSGGGIIASGGTVAVTDTTVSGNSADYGGGMWLGNGTAVALTNVTISGNSADTNGGGIRNAGTLTLVNTTLSGNSSIPGNGGGLYNAGTAVLTNATLAGNSAELGGGMFNASAGIATLTNTTVSGNTASDGAGIRNAAASGQFTLANSIVLGHVVPGNFPEIYGTVTYAGVNIVGLGGDFDPGGGVMNASSGDAVFAQVTPGGVGVLADNGGPVQTIALSTDPANLSLDSGVATRLDETAVGIDLNGDGVVGGTITTDARGFPRVAGAGVDLGALERQAGLAFEVTTLEDEIDSVDPNATITDMGGIDDLSLREALFLAQQDPTSVDDITFASDLIGGTTPLVDNGEIVLVHGELVVFGNVNIDGDVGSNGTGDITVRAAAANPSAVLHFYHGISSLNGVTVTGGNALYGAGVSVGAYYGACGCSPSIYADLTITNSVIQGNDAYYGGGISVDSGSSLRLVDSTVTDNDADVGGGIAVRQGGTLTVVDSTISANHVDFPTSTYGSGGGIASRGTVTVIGSTISGNSAYYGGGIYNNGVLTLVNTTLVGNTAETGGGLYNYSALCGCHPATVTLVNTTVSGNVATYGDGGGIANYLAELTLINTTLHSNVASGNGGGVANYDGVLNVINSTLSGNYAGDGGGGIYSYLYSPGTDFTLTNSIVAGNLAGSGSADISRNGGAYLGRNIVGDTLFDGNVAQPGPPLDLTDIFDSVVALDLGGTIPVFDAGELANNGGPVQTILILTNGAAHDRGDNAFLPDDIADLDGDNDAMDDLPFDARGAGFDRVINADVDLGAVEIQDGPPSGNTAGGSIQYVEDQAPTALDPTLTVSDPGGFLTGAEIAITGNFAAGQDLLGFTNQSGITGSFNAATGVLTLTGLATDVQYQAALRTVTYSNTSQNPSNAARTVNFQVDDGGGLVDIGNVGVNVIPVLDPPGDVNGDHTTDIVWRDDAGTVALWEMDGVNVLANNGIATQPTTWDIIDTNGDYDGDGNSDILWRDDTGGVVLWTMDGPNILAETEVAGPIADYWQVADTGDFTGDGRADILWRDTAGRVVLWEMNGADIVDNTLVADVLPSWQLHDSADFNGDGRNDLLWRDDDQNIRIWLMDGATRVSDRIVASLPDYWGFADTGDFNGDARYDILWRDDTGTVVMWEMDGTAIVDNTSLGTIREYWQIADTGDYDGDLNHDILWRDTAGAIVLWQMDGPTILDSTGVNTIDPRWHIEA